MEGSHVICPIDGSQRAMAAVHFACDHLLGSPLNRLEGLLKEHWKPQRLNGTSSSTQTMCAGPANVFASNYPGMDKYALEEKGINERNAAKTKAANDILYRASEDCAKLRVAPGQSTYHGLPALGGATGVADALVHHSRLKGQPLVVMSNRGAGSVAEGNSAGLGSVSRHCVKNVPYATIIVPSALEQCTGEASEGDSNMNVDSRTRICLCVDGSEVTTAVLALAVRHFARASGAELHLVSVAAPLQLPMHLLGQQDATMDEQNDVEGQDVDQNLKSAAERVCLDSMQYLQSCGFVADQVQVNVLESAHKTEEVAERLATYCRQQSINLCMMGSFGNGLNAAQAAQRWTGLGSVADGMIARLPCAVGVVRPDKWTPPAQGQHATGTARTSAESPL